MRYSAFAGRALCLAALIAGCASPGLPGPRPQSAREAAPSRTFPLPVIELWGTPAEIGQQHGARLSGPIHILHDQYLGVYLGNPAKRFLALAAAGGFAERSLPEHRAEVEALARGAGIAPGEAMLAQCFLDLSPMTACSTVTLPASAAPDRVARFGRNLDFPSHNVADRYSTVFIYHPRGCYAFAAVGWPGLVGVLSGMNEKGLALANMEVRRPARLPDAMPYTLLYRTLLERCATVDEAIALLQATPRQTANNLMLMDADGNRAVVEITPEAVEVRRGREGAALISTNHQRGQDADAAGGCRRYDLLRGRAQCEYGAIDVASLEAMLAGASQGNFTLQSMIFEPSTRVLYIAAGKDAARRQFYRLDLGAHFN